MAGDKPIRWGDVKMSREQVAQVLYQAGFRGQDLINFVGIAFRESGGHPNLYVERPSTGDWSYGLFGLNIGKNNKLWPAYQKMGFTDPEQLATATGGAKAAYELWKQMGYYPWGGYKGKSGTYGTDLKAAQAGVERAQAQGLLGQAYTGPGAGTYGTSGSASSGIAPGGTAEDPLGWGAIKAGMDQSEATFNAYLKTQSAERQQQIIDELKQPRDLGQLAQYMASAPQGVNDYITYLSKLPGDAMEAAKGRLAVQAGATADPGAAPPNAAASQELTNLLQTFGVSYPNAPQPTPALLAFLKGVGLNLSTAEDVKRRAIERIGASTSDAMADIDRAAGRNKQNITADLVRRGILSSGESTTRYARQAEDVAAQQSDVTRTSAQAKETAEDAYRQSQDLARQQALDRVIGAEQDQATQTATAKAQADALKAQQAASDLSWQRQQQAQSDALKAQTDAIAKYAAQGVVV